MVLLIASVESTNVWAVRDCVRVRVKIDNRFDVNIIK